MGKLLKIESIKTFSSNTFRTLISLHLIFFLLVILTLSKIDISMGTFSVEKLYQFPHVYDFFAWISSWFNILLAIIVIVLVSNEFRYRTFKQHIIDGLSREDLIIGKINMLLIIAVYGLILVFLASLVSGFIVNGDDTSFYRGMDILLIYFVQTLSYISMGLLFAILFRNNALAIITFILYLFPGELIIRKLFFPSVENYFPAKLISDLTPFPEYVTQGFSMQGLSGQMNVNTQVEHTLSQGQSVIISVVYLIVFLGISYWLMKKRNLT